MKVVVVSGGFDPIHAGHVKLFNEAKKLGDKLVVILNNDNWLKLKKGYVFINQAERKLIIENLKAVDEVLLTEHQPDDLDRSVCKELRKIKPSVFANGGDRTHDNIPEVQVCNEENIEMVFNVGGSKIQSSSWLVDKMRRNYNE